MQQELEEVFMVGDTVVTKEAYYAFLAWYLGEAAGA